MLSPNKTPIAKAECRGREENNYCAQKPTLKQKAPSNEVTLIFVGRWVGWWMDGALDRAVAATRGGGYNGQWPLGTDAIKS